MDHANEYGFILGMLQGVAPSVLISSMLSVVALCDAHNIDVREHILPALAALRTEPGSPLPLGVPIDQLLRGSIDRPHEIEALYAELRRLAGDAKSEARYQERLGRLRTLQAAEAEEMAAFFESRRLLRRGEVDSVLNRVDALLHDHENPPSSDRASERRG